MRAEEPYKSKCITTPWVHSLRTLSCPCYYGIHIRFNCPKSSGFDCLVTFQLVKFEMRVWTAAQLFKGTKLSCFFFFLLLCFGLVLVVLVAAVKVVKCHRLMRTLACDKHLFAS